MNASQQFIEAIAAAGLTPPDEIIGDRKIHRFSSNGNKRDDAGWYIFFDDERPAGRFGCNRAQIDATWSAKSTREFTPEEKKAWRDRMDAARAQREADQQAERDACAATAADMWSRAAPAPHPYAERKLIETTGTRVLDGELLVPLRHGPGALVGLQRIRPDGTKLFLKGTPAGGAYTVLGKPTKTGPVVICEGWATGVSIQMATGYCVVVAFNAGNLAPVAQKIRAALPDAVLVIAADDDAFTVRPEGHPQAGQPWNPGVEAAAAAAEAVGASVVMPDWIADRGRGTDFNDLHVSEGIHAVRACFIDLSPPKDSEPVDNAPKVNAASDRPAARPTPPVNNPASGGAGLSPLPVAAASSVADKPAQELLPVATDAYAPNCSDDDLSARHLDRMASNTLWCEMWGRWLLWNGDRWLRDETNMVFDLVRQSCRMVANDVLLNMELTADKRQRQADKIASFRTISSVERLSRAYREVSTHPDEWDQDRWLLNTPGGVVDLRQGVVRPHSREDRFTKITAVAPSGVAPASSCPTWLAFLERATGGNQELIGFLRRMCGYALTGEVREHALFFVYGTGGNGKGTFLNTITHIMGDYQRVSGSETFTESPGDRHTTELARLQGARLVTAQETEEGKRWAESRIKALTGGDPITARFMRQDDFTFLPQFKLVIVGNHKPSFRNVDDAIRRRLHLVPFTAVIPASEKDPMLSEKLKAEAPGILQWMIEGCIEWARDGLMPPSVVKESTDQYLGSEDSLQQWIDDCCDVGTGGFATSKALFYSWSKWCEQSGEFVGTMKRLMAKLESRGISTGQKFKGARGCIGIKIKDDDLDPY